MRLDGAQRAAKVVVDAIPALRVGLVAGALADDEAVGGEPPAHRIARGGVVARLLGDDVTRAGQRRLDVRHLVGDKWRGHL